jgi:3-deoxy-manno-octulosonate cytidylyltransferase (CMP-KDO synthetase)
MNVAIIIPARYASKRLPGKPLLRQTGKYLVQHVYERASHAHKAKDVLIATDDSRIEAAVKSFGGRVVRTRANHPSGTDRVAEACRDLNAEIIINLQADEPLIEPESLDLLPELLQRDAGVNVATLAVPITSEQKYRDPHCVKVVCDSRGRALYFSRAPIPWVREGQLDFAVQPPRFLQHVGLYAYRRTFLMQLAAAGPAAMEELEKLEQLRILEMGQAIQVGMISEATIGVDTLADYEDFVRCHRQTQARVAA